MFRKNQLSCAIAAAIGASMVVSNSHAAIEEVIVTATKTAQSTQDIPVAVQALGEDSLDELRVGNFTDYIKYLPNVNFAGRGPGQNNLYIRGIAAGDVAVFSSEVAGSAPNVALYLDEAPVTAVGRNLDVYVSDIERVEVLPGPQGTLFGASSQAGTVRLITNKPQLDAVSAGIDMTTSFTHAGEMNTGVEGYFNLPLIEDRLALRLSMYSINQGGYIDNVAGTTSLPTSNPRLQADRDEDGFPDLPADRDYEETPNTNLIEDNFNDSSYKGGRLGLKFAFNDDWNALLQVMNQELVSDGVFDYDPEVGELKVQRFFPDEIVDEFTQTAWTVEGRIAALDLIYTGSYLDREVNQSIDYTGYANVGPFIPGYICVGGGGVGAPLEECASSVLGNKSANTQERITQEARITLDTDGLINFTTGIYYDDNRVENVGNWIYDGALDRGFIPRAPRPDTTVVDSSIRPLGTVFFNDVTRIEEQKAIFGEITFNVLEQLSFTLGARYYEIDLELLGSSGFAGTTLEPAGRALDGPNGVLSPAEEDGEVFKGTVNFTPNDDLLFYFTYSEGFRPGGFNRIPTYRVVDPSTSSGFAGANEDTPGAQPVVPVAYKSDTLENLELGWKTSLGDSVQFNGSIYYIVWSDMQTSVFNPGDIEVGGSGQNLNYLINGGESEIKGIEGDFIAQLGESWTLTGAFSFNDTEMTELPIDIRDKPEEEQNIVPVGSELSVAPEFQANLRLRQEFNIGNRDSYWQIAAVHRSSAFTSIVKEERFEVDSYETFDLAWGLAADEWNFELFIENLTDERAELFKSNQDDVLRIVTNRPRTVGARVSFDF